MLFKNTAVFVLLTQSATNVVDGFTSTQYPPFLKNVATRQHVIGRIPSSLSMTTDPFASFHDFSFVSTQLLSDATDTAVAATDAVAKADNNGGLGFLTAPIEALLRVIHSAIVSVGVDSNAWGISIIALTVLIKAVTYPLTRQQFESTVKMQTVQPLVKELQAKYQSNPEVMNQKVAALYQENGVNPLAGCLPALVTLPVFVGLYRAVFGLAKENLLDEPFLWLPSLEGPTYGAELGKGNDWLTKGLIDGAPSLGWEDTAAFITIPVILIISQVLSIELNKQFQTPEQQEQSDNIVFKLLPLFLGWVSVGVPSALGLYWISNNLITTALTLQIRNSLNVDPPSIGPVGGGTDGATMTPSTTTASFMTAPMREKPAGFASSSESSQDGVSPLTASALDAEVLDDATVATMSESSLTPKTPGKKRGKKKKRKKN